jgi:hypothetical protein
MRSHRTSGPDRTLHIGAQESLPPASTSRRTAPQRPSSINQANIERPIIVGRDPQCRRTDVTILNFRSTPELGQLHDVITWHLERARARSSAAAMRHKKERSGPRLSSGLSPDRPIRSAVLERAQPVVRAVIIELPPPVRRRATSPVMRRDQLRWRLRFRAGLAHRRVTRSQKLSVKFGLVRQSRQLLRYRIGWLTCPAWPTVGVDPICLAC